MSSLDDDIGVRLRKVRSLHGLSQRALARRAGVSNAMISLIENGRSNPSIGMLRQILDGLPMSMAGYFAMEVQDQQKVFFGREELPEIGSRSISYRQVGGDLTDRKLQMLYERYAPGADTGQAMLSHEAEEAGLIIAGHLEVTVGEETRLLGPGDAYLFDSRIPHRFRNPGTIECVLVSACTPPSF
jgi:transcriptional regulator with XRE-family HTH domain